MGLEASEQRPDLTQLQIENDGLTIPVTFLFLHKNESF